MRLFRLGLVEPIRSQACYHALAELGHEGLILVSPASRYVCLGYFQDPGSSIDLDLCRREGIPVCRRLLGGGTTLLDQDQVFYQVVVRRDNPVLPAAVEDMYRVFSRGAIEAYRVLGLDVRWRPVNDLVTTQGVKISGQGAGTIGPCAVFVGNIIMDFDYDTMVRVLRVPDEKFRDKVSSSLRANLTTLRQEIGAVPAREDVEEALARGFATLLGPLEEAKLPEDVLARMPWWEAKLCRLTSSSSRVGSAVVIRSGVQVGQGHHKAPGGLITAVVEWVEGRIGSAHIYGDFSIIPREGIRALEAALQGLPHDVALLTAVLDEVVTGQSIDCPGVTPQDFAMAVSKSLSAGN